MRRTPGSLLDELAPEIRAPLDRASALARRLGLDLHLVGGAVRDLLLGERLHDLDLVWEGAPDPRRVANAYGDEFEVRASYHPEFLTASLILPGGRRLDIGRARAEVYPTAAALPRVHPSTLAEDLRRRDFSVNAMAVSLAAPGVLIDLCGGSADLELRQLRILHQDSFRDDPTRILRGCELAIRRHLPFESMTAAKIEEAVESRFPSLLSGSRVRQELKRLLGSPRHAAAGARLLRAVGMDVALRAEFEIDPRGSSRLERLREWTGAAGGTGEPLDLDFWIVALGALFWHRPLAVRRDLANWLHLTRVERDWLESVPERLAPLIEPAEAVESDLEEMATLYSGLSAAETRLADLLSDRPGRERLKAIAKLARLELGISGRDLVAAGISPGPRVGEALAATLTALRRKQISAGGELAFALSWLADRGERDAR